MDHLDALSAPITSRCETCGGAWSFSLREALAAEQIAPPCGHPSDDPVVRALAAAVDAKRRGRTPAGAELDALGERLCALAGASYPGGPEALRRVLEQAEAGVAEVLASSRGPLSGE